MKKAWVYSKDEEQPMKNDEEPDSATGKSEADDDASGTQSHYLSWAALMQATLAVVTKQMAEHIRVKQLQSAHVTVFSSLPKISTTQMTNSREASTLNRCLPNRWSAALARVTRESLCDFKAITAATTTPGCFYCLPTSTQSLNAALDNASGS